MTQPHTAIRRAGRAWGKATQAIGLVLLPGLAAAAVEVNRALARLDAVLRADVRAANDVVRIEGLGARFYVRAGLDPEYATQSGLAGLVRALLAGDAAYDPALSLVTPENRRRLAVSAMLGWATAHPAGGQYAAHRLWGTTRVEVSCG